MILDDNESNLMPLEAMLSEIFKIKVTCFQNPFEAVKAYKSRLQRKCCARGFKLVLTDISMPEMDGYEVSKLMHLYYTFWFEGFQKSRSF